MPPLSPRPPAARTRGRPYLLGAAVFAVGGLILASPWLSGRVTIPWDAKAHFQPQFAFLARALHAGVSPFWTPNVFDGSPQIADPQSLIFAPFFLLAAWLDPAPSFVLEDALTFGMLGLGGLAVLAWFRDRGWSAAGATLAAFAFAFGGSAAWRIQHVGQIMSLAWFPVTLFALSRALDRGSILWGAAAGLAGALLLLGRDQVAMLELFVLSAYAVMRIWPAPKRAAGPIAAGAVVGLVVAALPLALTVALALQSNRPEIDLAEAAKGSLHPGALLTLVSADLYGLSGPLAAYWGPPSPAWGETGLFLARNMAGLYMGAAPALAVLALAVTEPAAFWRDRDARFLTIAAALLLLYALGGYTPVFSAYFLVPGVDLWRRPADATFPLCAIVALLGGFALHRIERIGMRLLFVALGALILAGVCVAVAAAKNRLGPATPALWTSAVFGLAALAALVAAARLRGPRAILLIGALMTADLAVGNAPNESTALPPADFDMLRPGARNTTIALLKEKLRDAAAPDRRDRIELAGLGFAWPNASLVHDLDHDLGYNPVRTALFEAFTGAGDHVALPEQRVFSKAFPSYRSPAADLSGLRFIATGVPIETIDKSLKPGDLRFLARTADAYLYENPRALPRVLLATRAIARDPDALIRDGGWPDADYSRAVVLADPSAPDAPRRPGAASLTRYGTTIVEAAAEAPDGGWLVLNDVWHPWWRATVDGEPAPILRANGMFRAVALAPGVHAVRFTFEPIAGLFADLEARLFGRTRP